jgi:pre-rRNA-processing protein RIX1
VPLHKLRTRISSLLQHRSPAGRLTAAVLIKTIAEVGQPGESTIWEPWARGLISCLNKFEPWEIKRVYLAAVVRVFLLTKDSPTLQREVSNPLLPHFLTASLAAIKPIQAKTGVNARATPSRLLPDVLRAWNELLQVQPGTFRPFLSRIQPICLSIMSDVGSSNELKDIAAQVLSSTHLCSPKATASSDWESTVSRLIQSAHSSLDLVLRAHREQWYPSEASMSHKTFNHDYSKEPELINSDSASLNPWKGISEGGERVSCLLHWLAKMLSCSSMTVSAPLGHLLDLTSRISSISILAEPADTRKNRQSLAEVAREERDEVQAVIPFLHSNCLALISQISILLESATTPILEVFVDQLFEIFEASKSIASVRRQIYITLANILRSDNSFSLHLNAKRIEGVCVSCGRDIESGLLQQHEDIVMSKAPHHVSAITLTETSKQGQRSQIYHNEDLARCALQLWPLLLEGLHSSSLSNTARATIDRVSILVGDERSMFASIMNPSTARRGKGAAPSILPFFAQAVEEPSMILEAIKRPRLPLTYLSAGPNIEQISRSLSPKQGDPMATRRSSSVPEESLLLQEPSTSHLTEISTGQLDAAAALDIPNHSQTNHGLSVKRDFAATRDNGNGSQSALPGDEDTQHSKKARFSNHEPILDFPVSEIQLPEKRSQEKAIEPKDLSTASFRSLVAFPQPLKQSSTQGGIGSVEEDSDSDIPSINPALATDDELDEEEDEEDDEDAVTNNDAGV